MKKLELKYGCNPNQKPAFLSMKDGGELPFEIVSGNPGYINFLDALNSWQLVRELHHATNTPSAASFKHVSPASAAIGKTLSANLKKACFVDDIPGLDDSQLACAYARARGGDRVSSFGDWIALSDTCDATTARIIKREVSDGVIAPDYTPEALEILSAKKNGKYNIIKINKDYTPDEIETKEVFGVTFTQNRNNIEINKEMLANIVTANKNIPESAMNDLLIALITLKYTQSNSVCFAMDGQAIGTGAGQQSRIHCTRLAGSKADTWQLRQHTKTLALEFVAGLPRPTRDNAIDAYVNNYEEDICADGVWQQYFVTRPEPLTDKEKKAYLSTITGVALGSDAFFPFSDNIMRAIQSGVSYVAQPGGSVRDADVIKCCDEHNIAMAFTGSRLFHH